MLKKLKSLNIHVVLQLMLGLAASIMFGLLFVREMAAISDSIEFKERRAELVSFVTGRPKYDFRKSQGIASEPVHASKPMSP